MRFWDSSAILPLCVDEPKSPLVRSLLREDGSVAAWWATRTECLAGLMRRVREGTLDGEQLARARLVLDGLAGSWHEVQPSDMVRSGAHRLLSAHPLRAGDALQLSACLAWCGGRPADVPFVCFDARLREAALREGFDVVPFA